MRLRKIISGVAAASVASAALAMSASATLVVPENAPAYASFGTSMWMIKLYAPSEGTDFGIDCANIGKVVVDFKPTDIDWWEGSTGGAIVMSCGPTSATPSDHNWASKGYWGISDDENELYTMDDTQPLTVETLGDYTYRLTCDIDDSNCIYQEALDAEDGYAQIAFQEWGSDMSEIEIISMKIYDKSGNAMIGFDGDGNQVDGSVVAAVDEVAAAVDEVAAEVDEAVEEAVSAAAEEVAAEVDAALEQLSDAVGEETAVEEEAAAEETETSAEEAAPAETEAAAETTAAVDAAADSAPVVTTAVSTKGSPDTGIADVAVVAGIALLAGGAVVVAKKRK